MKKYEVQVETKARATVTIEAPDEASALEFLNSNMEYYGLNWEVDDMDGEVAAGQYGASSQMAGKWYGIDRAEDDTDADYVIDHDWLKDNGYQIETTVTKIK